MLFFDLMSVHPPCQLYCQLLAESEDALRSLTEELESGAKADFAGFETKHQSLIDHVHSCSACQAWLSCIRENDHQQTH